MKIVARESRLRAAIAALLAGAMLSTGPLLAQDEQPVPVEPESAEAAPAESESVETIPVEPLEQEQQQDLAVEEGQGAKLEAIEVTGSRIRRSNYETAQPITLVSREDIERSGVVSIGELLQDMPAAGSALNTQFNNGGTGATEIDLRNLGSNRVLVLVNGHRWVNGLRSLSTSSVDLNTIPLAIIDHVEVLKDGASAVYGSDAIAGVVNIITRKDFSGGELSTQYGMYTEGDGAQQAHSVSFGKLFNNFAGSSTLFGSVNFSDQRAIGAGDREISALPKANTGLTRGSSFLPEGRFLFIPTQQTGATLGAERCPNLGVQIAGGALEDPAGTVGDPLQSGDLPGLSLPPGADEALPGGVQLCDMTHVVGAGRSIPDSYRRYRPPEDNYNYAPANLLSTPLRSYGGFIAFNHDFGNSISLATEFIYNQRESTQQLATQPLCMGGACPIVGGVPPGSALAYNQLTYVSRDNPFNPFGQDIGRTDPADPSNEGPQCTDPTLGICSGFGAVLRRPLEAGPRIQDQTVPTMFGHVGLRGDLDLFAPVARWVQPLSWQVGYGYGRSKQKNVLLNSLRVDRIQTALGDDCTGDCVPLDVFGGLGTITPEMLNYIRYDAVDYTTQTQNNFSASISSALDNLLPAGPLGFAFGIEYRKDEYQFTPDLTQINGTSAGLSSAETQGSVKAKEAFIEFQIPVLSNVLLVQDLKLSLAGRYSDYDTFGTSENGKIGIEYRPYSDLLLRTTYSTSFRAPDVGNLYLGLADSYPALADPCVGRTAGSNADTNCTADGVPEDVPQNFVQYLAPFGGNPELKPETSRSFSVGLVFSPEFVQGLDLTVDYFDIELDEFISVPGAQTVLEDCYEFDPDHRRFCDSVVRDPGTGELRMVFNLFQNFPRIQTSGFDISLAYKLPFVPDEFGALKFVSEATFLSSYNQYLLGSSGDLQEEGVVGQDLGDNAYPRWKINPSLQWARGPWNASWSARIIWKTIESCEDGIPPSLTELGLCSDPNHLAEDGSPDPRNEIERKMRNDLQVGYNYEPYKASVVFGIQNIFDEDPPISYSAFANSFNASDYWIPGVLGYLRLQKNF